MIEKKKIVWDIDDVLTASAAGFVKYSNERWGHNLVPDDYHEDWGKVWGVSLEEAIRRAEEFHISGVVGTYKHFPEAIPILRGLMDRYEHVVGTSRRIVLRPETEALVMTGPFRGIFSAVHYVGIWDEKISGESIEGILARTKAELCKAIGADYLVDDQLKHCLGTARIDVPSVLYGNYRWNQTDEPLPPNVMRAADWQAVKEYFDAQN